MLTKYTLIHIPEGGVDHLINGRRVTISDQLSDEEADQYVQHRALQKYFQPILISETHGENTSQNPKSGKSAKASAQPRGAGGRFISTKSISG